MKETDKELRNLCMMTTKVIQYSMNLHSKSLHRKMLFADHNRSKKLRKCRKTKTYTREIRAQIGEFSFVRGLI